MRVRAQWRAGQALDAEVEWSRGGGREKRIDDDAFEGRRKTWLFWKLHIPGDVFFTPPAPSSAKFPLTQL